MVKAVNSSGGEAKLDDSVLDDVYEMWWPKLEEEIKQILAEHQNGAPAEDRSERDILEEILELTRLGTRNRRGPREFPPEVLVDLVDGIDRFMQDLARHGTVSPQSMHTLERPIRHLAEITGHLSVLDEFRYKLLDNIEAFRKRRNIDLSSDDEGES